VKISRYNLRGRIRVRSIGWRIQDGNNKGSGKKIIFQGLTLSPSSEISHDQASSVDLTPFPFFVADFLICKLNLAYCVKIN
jgi:hypothetical protein